MPAVGNVVAFPKRDVRNRHDATLSAVVVVSCALRTLGEPARLSELAALAGRVDPQLDHRTVADVLHGAATDELDGVLPFALFRPVALQGEEAWAFSPEYRAVMRQAGLEPTLR